MNQKYFRVRPFWAQDGGGGTGGGNANQNQQNNQQSQDGKDGVVFGNPEWLQGLQSAIVKGVAESQKAAANNQNQQQNGNQDKQQQNQQQQQQNQNGNQDKQQDQNQDVDKAILESAPYVQLKTQFDNTTAQLKASNDVLLQTLPENVRKEVSNAAGDDPVETAKAIRMAFQFMAQFSGGANMTSRQFANSPGGDGNTKKESGSLADAKAKAKERARAL